MQAADLSKGNFAHDYQSAYSLLVIDIIFLEERDGDNVVKVLVAVDSHSNSVTSYVVKRPTAGMKCLLLTPE